MSYSELTGDLIALAREGKFDVIAHGCNCFCTQGAGIALQMDRVFNKASFPLEHPSKKGSMNKLGCIDSKDFEVSSVSVYPADYIGIVTCDFRHPLTVVNCYTQYSYGRGLRLDYEALTLCMRKINFKFKSKRIGLPKIGAGLAGGSWDRIKEIIKKELIDMETTIITV